MEDVGKFSTFTNISPTRMLAQDTKQYEENVELCLELSLNGMVGANPTKTWTSANTSALKMKEDDENGELNLGLSLNGKFGVNPRISNASSLPAEITDDEWRKRRRLDKNANGEVEIPPSHCYTQAMNLLGMNKQVNGTSSSEEEMIDFETFLKYIDEDLVNVAHSFFASEAAKKK